MVRTTISLEQGDDVLFGEYRHLFYITNDWEMAPDQVVAEVHGRCDQENLHAPVNTLNANCAYLVMASLAWTLKARCALYLPVSPRWAGRHNAERKRLVGMEFRTFRHAFIEIPCQIVKGARAIR